jgi:signal peptidase I
LLPSIIGFRFAASKSRKFAILALNLGWVPAVFLLIVVFAIVFSIVFAARPPVGIAVGIASISFLSLWIASFVLAVRSKPGLWKKYVGVALCLLIIGPGLRAFVTQPYSIPSSGDSPTLLVGDYILVSKYSYGYTHYSLPFSPQLFSGRIFASDVNRGDVVVFRLPKDDSVSYIKRVVGLPGDHIQMIHGALNINGVPVQRERVTQGCVAHEDIAQPIMCYRETLPNGVSYITHYFTDNGFLDNTEVYTVPPGEYFTMGDNRDNSTDSRVLSAVGYVPFENLIGKAQIIYFSIREGEHAWTLWRWPRSVRWDRIFSVIR